MLVFRLLNNLFIFLFDPNQGTTLYGTRTVLCPLFWRYDLTAEQLFYMKMCIRDRVGAYGIRTPVLERAALIRPEALDLVLVPCTAFDAVSYTHLDVYKRQDGKA